MSKSPEFTKKVTTTVFRAKKSHGDPITMLTAYDYLTARAVDLSGMDSILVGDSLGMVILGYENTLPVTMANMLNMLSPSRLSSRSAGMSGRRCSVNS